MIVTGSTARASDDRRAPSPRWSGLLPLVIVPMIALGVFLPSLANGFVGWDDEASITTNPHMTEPGGLQRIWTTRESEQYYPLTLTTFWVEYRMFGRAPLGYHATQTVLHALNTLALMLVLRGLGASLFVSCLVSLLFAVHPLQVMSVAWVAERKNLLSCLFSLLALQLWAQFRGDRRGRWYAGSLLAFAAALLSKTAAAALPLAIVALDRSVFRVTWRSTGKAVVPLLALSAAAALITIQFEQKFIARVPEPAIRPLIAAAAILFYAWKLLVPLHLLPIYPLWSVALDSLIWWLPLVALASITLALAPMRRRLDGLAKFGLVFFVALLLPSLGIVAFGNLAVTYVSDHYVYVASIGFFLVIALALDSVRRRSPALGAVITIGAGILLAAHAALSLRAIPVFESAESMWSRTLEGNPDCFPAHMGLGRVHANRQEWEEAATHYQRATEILPEEFDAGLALGAARLRLSDDAAAEAAFLAVTRKHPEMPDPIFDLGLVAERRRDIDRAIEMYERALMLDPRYARAHLALGGVYLGLLERERAEAHFRAAMALDPSDPQTRVGIATCQRGRLQFAQAVETLRQALAASPDSLAVMNLLARILATAPDEHVRSGLEAVALAERACRATRFRNFELLDTLAAAYAETGDFEKAASTAQAAADLAQAAANEKALGEILHRLEQFRNREVIRELPVGHGRQ